MFAALQKAIPKKALTRFLGVLGNTSAGPVKNALIRSFIRAYDVDMSASVRRSPQEFRTFSDFFTRELIDEARPICSDPNAIVSPADGTVSRVGSIDRGTLIQAKGHRYLVADLLSTSTADTGHFDGGSFATIYLAPRDYHRVHAPLAATLEETVEVPGALFSVNASTEAGIEGLFCRNERLVCRLETGGHRLALVMIGAMVVASIETVWSGPRSPYRIRIERRPAAVAFGRGDEMGRFTLGSTVIVLIPPELGAIDHLDPGARLQMGQRIGVMHGPSEKP